MPGAPGPAGPPQFPSTDPNVILSLLTQLWGTDQVALVGAQQQAGASALATMLQNSPDPSAAAAVTAPGAPAPPTLASMDQNGSGGGGTGY